jgi:hypothetical protein
MAKFDEGPDIFDEIAKLIELIPVDTTLPSNAILPQNVTLDSRYHAVRMHSLSYLFTRLSISETSVSFRDIIRMFNTYLTGGCDKNTIFQRYRQLSQIGCTYPVEYLLFDYCLALLDGDFLDAKLYLAHSYHIVGLRNSLNILLSVIINDALRHDKDVREFVTRLGKTVEPRNARTYIDSYGPEFANRYRTYLTEVEKLN